MIIYKTIKSTMGIVWSAFGYGSEPMRILITGLNGVGKTTLLYKIVTGKTVQTIPTVGFNVETIHYKNVALCVWDSRRGPKMAPLLRHYYSGTRGIIFVIDSTDYEDVENAIYELWTLLQDEELRNVPFLIYANKQDQANARSTDELVKLFKLDNWNTRRIHLQPACATEGRGLLAGLDWLCAELKQ